MKGPHPPTTDLSAMVARIRANLGVLVGGSGAVAVLGFVATALNARALGPQGLGVLSLFQASALLVAGLFSFGTQQPVIRLGKQAMEERDVARLGAIAGLGLLVDMVAAAVAGVVGLIVVTGFADALGIDAGLLPVAQFYTVVVFLSGVTAATGVFRLFNCFHYLSLAQVGSGLALLGVAAVFGRVRAPLEWYLVAHAVIQVLAAQIQVAIALWLLHHRGASLYPRLAAGSYAALGREFLAYAWTTNLTGVINSVRANAEPILLGLLFSTSTVGIYNVVRQLAGAFNKLAMAGSSAIFPEVAELASRGDAVAARQLLTRLVVSGALLGLAGVAVLALLAEPLLRVGFGEAFVAGDLALVLMGLVGAVTLSSASFGGFVQAFASPVRLLRLYVVAFLVYACTAPPLIALLGLNGAPLGQLGFALALALGCWRVLDDVMPVRGGGVSRHG